MFPGGIQTHNPSKREAADSHFILRGMLIKLPSVDSLHFLSYQIFFLCFAYVQKYF
jgi:hypothetical protein